MVFIILKIYLISIVEGITKIREVLVEEEESPLQFNDPSKPLLIKGVKTEKEKRINKFLDSLDIKQIGKLDGQILVNLLMPIYTT